MLVLLVVVVVVAGVKAVGVTGGGNKEEEDAKGSSGKAAGKGRVVVLLLLVLVLMKSKFPNAAKVASIAGGGGDLDGEEDWLQAVEYSKMLRDGTEYAGTPTWWPTGEPREERKGS